MWALDDQGSSSDPCSETYRGTSAFSEPETQIIRDKAIQTAYINLEMRYQTYARDSWVAVVLKAVSQTKSCDCETCQLWYIRENHIIEEIHKQLWIYHNNENERERC